MSIKTWQERSGVKPEVVGTVGYEGAMQQEIDELRAENAELKKDLIFVERWANHHGTKSCHSAESILGVIQHYPSIKAITKSYADGVLPTTPDPYAENAAQRVVLEQALEALESLFGIPEIYTGKGAGGVAVWRLGGSALPRQAITAIQEQLK